MKVFGLLSLVISQDHFLQFLIYCFKEKKRAPSTIKSYKSSLVPVFRHVFGVEISEKIFNSLFRSFQLKAPVPVRHSNIDWNLDDVLNLIASLPRPLSILEIMSKCAFLLFLTTAGRCSEVASFSRMDGHIHFLPSGSVSLLPLPSFLAKNEDPSLRFEARVISPFHSSISFNLCPVLAVKEALSVSSLSPQDNALILHPASRKSISISKLRILVCSFIKRACPSSFPKSHDIRKLASSSLFLNSGSLKTVINHCNWHTSKAFIKHYILNDLESNSLARELLRVQT